MNSIGWIIPIIIVSIIFNVISKAAKRISQQQQNQAPGQRQDLQQILRQQVSGHQGAARPESAGSSPQNSTGLYRPPLQAQTPGPAMEGTPLNRFSMEGTALGRSSLEGLPLEGISLENAKSPDRITPTELGDGDSYSINRRRMTGSKSVRVGNRLINQSSIVNGVIMSEVLSSRGGRKRTK